ncbi:hypothetical protein F4782DRAFT_547254, partial [Xylaria castorea]
MIRSSCYRNTTVIYLISCHSPSFVKMRSPLSDAEYSPSTSIVQMPNPPTHTRDIVEDFAWMQLDNRKLMGARYGTPVTEERQSRVWSSSEETIDQGNTAEALRARSSNVTQEFQHHINTTSKRATSQIVPEHHDWPLGTTTETNNGNLRPDLGPEGSLFQALPNDTSLHAGQIPDLPSFRRLPIQESLGRYGCLSIIGGSVIVLGLLSFLMFLWFGHGSFEAADASQTWRQIAINDLMTEAVTLIALAIRLIVSLQTAVCTSMLAALVLEKRFTSKFHVAWFSIIRSTNDGPMKMMTLLSSRHLRYIEFWLLFCLALGTLGLQFSSTILLLDFTNSVIVSDVSRIQVPDLLSTNSTGADLDIILGSFFIQTPTFGVFGEVNSSSNLDVLPDPHGFSYTGLIQRGFLPFPDKDNRTSVRHFGGNAMIMSSKVACMRPQLGEKLSFVRSIELGSRDDISLQGQLRYGRSLQMALPHITNPFCDSDGCEETGFSCNFPFAISQDPDFLPSTACYIGRIAEPSQLPLDFEPQWNSSDDPWSQGSAIFLIISTNFNDTSQIPAEVSFAINIENHEWTSYEIIPGHFFNISLCFSGYVLDRKVVEMRANWALEEPVINWSPAAAVHNTSDVQRHLGSASSRANLAARNILDMQIFGEPDDGPPTSPANQEHFFARLPEPMNISAKRFTPRLEEYVFLEELSATDLPNTSFILCEYCNNFGAALSVSPESGILFSDIIAQTGRAANALLSYHAGVMWLVHYSFLSLYDIFTEAQVASAISARTPPRCTESSCAGLISVTALLGFHLITVAIITVLYVKQVRFSRYGNIWHAVSQLSSLETTETLDATNNASDKAGKHRDGDDDFVKLGVLENGRIEVVRHRHYKNTPGSSLFAKLKKHHLRLRKRKERS